MQAGLLHRLREPGSLSPRVPLEAPRLVPAEATPCVPGELLPPEDLSAPPGLLPGQSSHGGAPSVPPVPPSVLVPGGGLPVGGASGSPPTVHAVLVPAVDTEAQVALLRRPRDPG